MKKIVRSLCYFSKNPNVQTINRINELRNILENNNYFVQTVRLCAGGMKINDLKKMVKNDDVYLSVGCLRVGDALEQFGDFINAGNISFNMDLSSAIATESIDFLFKIMQEKAPKTFNFTYVFNNVDSSPYFPSANYSHEGFAIGLQSTDLAVSCNNLEDWFEIKKQVWDELIDLFRFEEDFLGIDSSVAPLFKGDSSLINIVRKLCGDFNESVLTDLYLKITDFIKRENLKPVGLCGLMLPCLEDFELAEEYEKGNFPIERNIFLSLHSGLGIDTYPIGIDEDKKRVGQVLKLVRGLSNKYSKPLSVRFVSDGKARIGEMTDFQNQYLKDVIVRKI